METLMCFHGYSFQLQLATVTGEIRQRLSYNTQHTGSQHFLFDFALMPAGLEGLVTVCTVEYIHRLLVEPVADDMSAVLSVRGLAEPLHDVLVLSSAVRLKKLCWSA